MNTYRKALALGLFSFVCLILVACAPGSNPSVPVTPQKPPLVFSMYGFANETGAYSDVAIFFNMVIENTTSSPIRLNNGSQDPQLTIIDSGGFPRQASFSAVSPIANYADLLEHGIIPPKSRVAMPMFVQVPPAYAEVKSGKLTWQGVATNAPVPVVANAPKFPFDVEPVFAPVLNGQPISYTDPRFTTSFLKTGQETNQFYPEKAIVNLFYSITNTSGYNIQGYDNNAPYVISISTQGGYSFQDLEISTSPGTPTNLSMMIGSLTKKSTETVFAVVMTADLKPILQVNVGAK